MNKHLKRASNAFQISAKHSTLFLKNDHYSEKVLLDFAFTLR